MASTSAPAPTFIDVRPGWLVLPRCEDQPVTVLRRKVVPRVVGGCSVSPDVTLYYRRADGSRGNVRAGSPTPVVVLAS